MGNIGSSGVNNRRRPSGNGNGRRIHPPPPPPVTPQPEITANRFMYPATAAAATPYHNYPGYYPPPPPNIPLPAPYDHHHRPVMDPMWGRYPQPPPPPAPYMEHQKAVTIKNDVNIKKETLRIEPDEENPGRFLVSFTFDATSDGRVHFRLTIWGVRLNSKVNCC